VVWGYRAGRYEELFEVGAAAGFVGAALGLVLSGGIWCVFVPWWWRCAIDVFQKGT
jgi:hypothetical protein